MPTPGSLTNKGEALLLNHWLGGPQWAPLPTHWYAYFVGDPGELGPGAEPSGGGYERFSVANNTTNYTVTNLTATHITPFKWAKATAPHGNVRGVGLFNSPTGGDLIGYWLLAAPIMVTTGVALELPAGALELTFATGGMSSYIKENSLRLLFGGIPMNFTPILYANLLTTAFTDATPGTEPPTARAAFNNDTSMFPIVAFGEKRNLKRVEWTEVPTGTNYTATGVGFWDSATGGNWWGGYTLSAPMSITPGTIPRIDENAVLWTLD